MNNYLKHFRKELAILRASLADGDNLVIEDFIKDIESITEKFSKQGHSGASAPCYAGTLCSAIRKVLAFEPLSPITGDESEWNHIGEVDYQNNRLGSVFKEGKQGAPYYLDAIIWSGEDEYDTFTGTVDGIASRQYIKLPFTPKKFYIDVVRDEAGEYHIKDRTQLNEVFTYYDKQ
jgi:hypothetical protein